MTIDTIFENKKEYSFGGIANVWRSFKQMESKAVVDVVPIQYGEALIYVDKDNSKRYSEALLNIKTFYPEILESKISLILYLNELINTDFLTNLNSFNIADTCKGKKLDTSLLKNIDFLLSSDEDIENINEITNNYDGIVLIHNEFGSSLAYKDKIVEFKLDKKYRHSNINVLGAGDIFLSYIANFIFLNNTYKLPEKVDQFESIETFLQEAHELTSKHLLKLNKDK